MDPDSQRAGSGYSVNQSAPPLDHHATYLRGMRAEAPKYIEAGLIGSIEPYGGQKTFRSPILAAVNPTARAVDRVISDLWWCET